MRKDSGNDRPLSLTSVPGKVREKIILSAIESPGFSTSSLQSLLVRLKFMGPRSLQQGV